MLPGKASSADNQFVNLLVNNLPQNICVKDFTWQYAIFGSFDVLHVHWPERLYRGKNLIKSLAKQILFLTLICKIKIFRVKIVYTVHNLKPHESLDKIQQRFDKKFQDLVEVRVFMQPFGDVTSKKKYIPHGIYEVSNYKGYFERKETKETKIVCLGFLRPSKSIERLITEFPEEQQFSLVIAGEPITPHYGLKLKELVQSRDNIELILGRVAQSDLLQIYRSANLAIVPYENTYNSGAALFALSIPVPLIATTSESMERLQKEIGEEWIQIINQKFESEEIREAVKNIYKHKINRSEKPLFSHERQWNHIGKEYSSIYTAREAT